MTGPSVANAPRVNIVTLGVRDVARSRAFYERLGLTASAASNANIAFFAAGGVVLALFGHDALAEDAAAPASPPAPFRGQTLAWNVASDAEVDATLARAVACGARLAKAGHKAFWGGYTGYFADPDGHLWEVAFNPFFPLDADGRCRLP